MSEERRERILIVDDTPDNRDLLEQILEDDYQVESAADGPTALERALATPPDLVLLDIQMPGMDGYEVLRRLQAEEATRHVPVIFLTARYRDPDRVCDGLDLGAVDYITKPVEDEILLAKIRAVLRVRRAEADRRRALEALQRAHKLESVGQLAAGIAHEINTPIQFIGDNLTFLREAFADLAELIDAYGELAQECVDSLPPERLARLTAIRERIDLEFLRAEVPLALEQSAEGAARVADIVRAMKRFAHPGEAEKTRADLNEIVRTAITVTTNEWKYAAELEFEPDESLEPIECLPGEISQVVVNLIVNAAHAIEDARGSEDAEKGRIRVRTARVGDAVELRVSDTGTGIPEDIRHRVFDFFFTTKEVGRGSGQGLAIAHSVVCDEHGGSIEFDTEVGRGTTFVVRLPARAASAQAA